MKRRTFLISGTLSAAACALWGRVTDGIESIQEHFTVRKSNFWKGNYFSQNSVDVTKLDQGIIRARVNGQWKDFITREFDDAFINWNIEDRLGNLETMRGGKMPDWSGAHNAAVATYGKNRGDSCFSLNNAFKGTGLCPKAERLDEMIARLKDIREKPHPEKFKILESNYKDTNLWDRSRLVSLELYATPDFETHTFLNQMENPVSCIVFLDIPSYELRTIAQLLHPKNPDLTDYEKKIVDYINTVHSYMHSHFNKIVPTVIYHVIEEFDNSPAGRSGKGKRGLRVV